MDFSWFLTIPGMLISGGVLLLIIALIIFIATSGKKNKKENSVSDKSIEGANDMLNNAASVPTPIENSTTVPEVDSASNNSTSITDLSGLQVNNMEQNIPSQPMENPSTIDSNQNTVENTSTPMEITPEMMNSSMGDTQNNNLEGIESSSAEAVAPMVAPVEATPEVVTPMVTPMVAPVEAAPEVVTPEVAPVEAAPEVVTPMVAPVEATPEVVTPEVAPVEAAPEVVTPMVAPVEATPEVVTPMVAPVEATPEVVTPEVSSTEAAPIYGGANPVQNIDLNNNESHQIYGGANPLENTQVMQPVEIPNVASTESVVPEQQPVQAVDTQATLEQQIPVVQNIQDNQNI